MSCTNLLFPVRLAALAASGLLLAGVCAADDLTQPLHASPDGHFLAQPDGAPFFWLGDTAWPLFVRLSREDADQYFRDRAGKGFTVIQATVLCGPWDLLDVATRNEAENIGDRMVRQQLTFRGREQVTRFFDGTDLLAPGLAWVEEWRPEAGDPAGTSAVWAAVGRKR